MNGQYLTPDLGALQQAESAYFQQKLCLLLTMR
jgi:hypothetical protein